MFSKTPVSLQVGDSEVEGWLHSHGLEFDPFVLLNAAEDPYLSKYLVGHERFAHVWGDWIAWLFAPPGGGKTALRVRTAQACWVGQATNRPFPIPYEPPYLSWERLPPTIEEHLLALGRAGSCALLLTLANRPHWLINLRPSARHTVRRALEWNLPGPLSTYLELCLETGSLTRLRSVLNLSPAFALPDPPEVELLQEWCQVMRSVPSSEYAPESACARWEALQEALLNALGLRSLYILLDGLDAAPETYFRPENVAAVLKPLVTLLSGWAKQRIYVKGFLPLISQPILQDCFPETFTPTRCASLEWSPALLGEVIRRRVYVASKGAFGSLDAIASPGLRDVETVLAEAVEPLPRELLVLIRGVLQTHLQREGVRGYLEEADVELAIRQYRKSRDGREKEHTHDGE